MNTEQFGIWFLVLSLFVPRITIIGWWLTNNLPFHHALYTGNAVIGFLCNSLITIFLPRILILVWIYQAMGFSPWFWIHLASLFFVFLGGILKGMVSYAK